MCTWGVWIRGLQHLITKTPEVDRSSCLKKQASKRTKPENPTTASTNRGPYTTLWNIHNHQKGRAEALRGPREAAGPRAENGTKLVEHLLRTQEALDLIPSAASPQHSEVEARRHEAQAYPLLLTKFQASFVLFCLVNCIYLLSIDVSMCTVPVKIKE